MKILESKAIVLSSIKYGDTSLVVRCFTARFGLKSFIAKGVFAKKKRNSALYFPLAEIDVAFSHKGTDQSLVFLNSAQTAHYYESLHFHPVKSAIVFFMAEFLSLVLKNEEESEPLYAFLTENLKAFDRKEEHYADFHLIFLLQLSYFIGFYPNLEQDQGVFFDLENGFFTDGKTSINMLNEQETILFKKLLTLDFNQESTNQFNQAQRHLLVELLVKYYQIHTTNFKKPKSLHVLHELFQ